MDITANLIHFWDLNSFIIVFGGTIVSLLLNCSPKVFITMFRHIKVLVRKKYPIESVIQTIYALSEKARKNGILTLEQEIKSMKEPFFRRGLMFLVDAMGAKQVKYVLEQDVQYMEQRHETSAEIYDKGASYATAFGVIGTLLQLVLVLITLGEEQGTAQGLGAKMALALLPILYGSILAGVVFYPIGRKLRVKNEEEVLYKQIVIEGIIAIQEGENPKHIKEQLLSAVEEGKREKAFSSSTKKG